MTNSEIFKSAHAMARNTVKFVGNYMIAFSLALKEVYKNMATKIVELKSLMSGKAKNGEKYATIPAELDVNEGDTLTSTFVEKAKKRGFRSSPAKQVTQTLEITGFGTEYYCDIMKANVRRAYGIYSNKTVEI